nr:unnamed protein product [Spirometra erinaceieuropaei]
MGLFGNMHIHESGIDRPPDSPTTPSPIPTSSPFAPITVIATDTDTTDFTYPHCPRTFTPCIGLTTAGYTTTTTTTITAAVAAAAVAAAAAAAAATTINTHPPQAPNRHLPRKWEGGISTRSPCASAARVT